MARLKGYDVLITIVLAFIMGHSQSTGDKLTVIVSSIGIMTIIVKLLVYGDKKKRGGN